MSLLRRISLVFFAGFVLASPVRAADFSLTGNKAVIDLPKGAQFPNGGHIKAQTLSIGPEGASVLTGVSAVLGMAGGRVEFRSSSGGIEETDRLYLQGDVNAVFFADQQAEQKLPDFSYAEVNSDRTQYHDGSLTLSGSTVLKIGNANGNPMTIQSPSITYTPGEGIIFPSLVRTILTRSAGELPIALLADSATVTRPEASLLVSLTGNVRILQEKPGLLSGTASQLLVYLTMTEGALLLERSVACPDSRMPVTIKQLLSNNSGTLSVESALPVHLDKVGLFISPETRFAGRSPITITSPDAAVTCSSVSSIFDEHSSPINVTCTEGTFVSKVSNRDISTDFTVLFFDFKTNTGRSNGSDYNQRPLTLRIPGTETAGAVEIVSQNLDFRISQKNADNTPVPSSAVFSGDTVIKLSLAKDHPSGGFTSDVTVTTQRVQITESGEGWRLTTPALSASGSAQSGSFTLKAGRCDANLDSSLAITSAVFSDALELVTPAGKLIGETATYENGRWLVSSHTGPVRFSREAVMLETEKVLFDPKTGEIIPEGGAFRVVESADK